LYADHRTGSMNQAIDETNRRRTKQLEYNKENNITPMSIIKSVDMQLARIIEADYLTVPADEPVIGEITSEAQMVQAIAQLEAQMREAAKNFEFERAAGIRDRVRALKQRDLGAIFSSPAANDSPMPTSAAPAATVAEETPLAQVPPPKTRSRAARVSKKS
jgi:excinuclease UvrABC helicase subunit UvrB